MNKSIAAGFFYRMAGAVVAEFEVSGEIAEVNALTVVLCQLGENQQAAGYRRGNAVLGARPLIVRHLWQRAFKNQINSSSLAGKLRSQ